MTIERRLIAIAGTSGSGKGTVIAALKEHHPEFVYPVSLTTRAPRAGEVDGVTYHFVSLEEFERAKEGGELLEWAVNHEQEYYGMQKKEVQPALDAGKIVVREMSLAGIEKLKKSPLASQLYAIFLLPPSEELMRARILKRSPLPEEEVQRRLRTAKNEINQATLCDVSILAEEGKQADIYKLVEGAILRASTSHE